MVCLGNEEITLSFLRLHPTIAVRTLVDHDGYSISSKGFLPAVVDKMVNDDHRGIDTLYVIFFYVKIFA